MTELRHRRQQRFEKEEDDNGDKGVETTAPTKASTVPSTAKQGDKEEKLSKQRHQTPTPPSDGQGTGTIATTTWFTTKWIILRSVGMVYFIAFLGAYYQNLGLIGTHGLQPATAFFVNVKNDYADLSPWKGFQDYPSIFWFMEMNDDRLQQVHMAGMLLSSLVVMGILDNVMSIMGLLWLLYFTVVTSATHTSFYGYGWESQMLETGFLSIFVCDNILVPTFWKNNKNPKPPSQIVLWLFRWLCFRISIGAGLIKLRGSSCWTKKTCLYYHFETQPIPSPLSFIFHFLPRPMLTHAVDLDLFVQVYTSWMVLLPTTLTIPGIIIIPQQSIISKCMLWIVRLGGFIQAGFMVNIMLSGNFAFLNHLTVIPALACLDDACWPSWMRHIATSLPSSSAAAATQNQPGRPFSWLSWARWLMDLWLLWTIGTLSRPVVENLLQIGGRRQAMNASYDPFRLVNTYGAFGSVGESRYEPIVSIQYDGDDKWIELEFPCKPGSVARRPCFCAPYHYRLDWNIWFIGFKPHQQMLRGRERWLFSLIFKLLENESNPQRPWLDLFDRTSAQLLRENYSKGMVPRSVKVDMYHYQMAAPLWDLFPLYVRGEPVVWWNRAFEEVLVPLVQL